MLIPSSGQSQGFSSGLATSPDIPPATTAETFEDLAGQGRRHPALGIAMAISCFSLIGLPLTVGFFGKLFLLRPALDAHMYWLVVITIINAAISAGYYLRIVGTMFLRAEPDAGQQSTDQPRQAMPIVMTIVLSAAATLTFGAIFPATQILSNQATEATNIRDTAPAPVAQAPAP
jgi:NADH-quinone oxidoreductase subunit N